MTERIQRGLLEMQDLEYKAFHSALMPTVDKDRVIGVRMPEMRQYAKKLVKEGECGSFLVSLPHFYYEENNLHALLIENIKDYDDSIKALEHFLPYIDNWATCDLLKPRAFRDHRPELLEQIKLWLLSEHTYTVRFGLGMLMTHFLDEDFSPDYLSLAASVRSEEYYVNMMQAWFFATALAKQWADSIVFIENKKLSPWVHNKTIQKAVESLRITAGQKQYLRTLRIKLTER